MDAFETLLQTIEQDIEKFSGYAKDAANAPDLFGIEGTDAKRAYYETYAMAQSGALGRLKPSLDEKDAITFSLERIETEAIQSRLQAHNTPEAIANAEGLGRVLDRLSQIDASIGFDKPAALGI